MEQSSSVEGVASQATEVQEPAATPAEADPTSGSQEAASEPVAPAPAPEAAPEPAFDVDAFDWDGYDYESYDAFPEAVRPILERGFSGLRSRHTAALENAQADAKSWESMYNAVFTGEPDPRIGTLTSERDSAFAARDEALAENKRITEAMVAYTRQEADRELEAFTTKNKALFAESPALMDAVADIVEITPSFFSLDAALTIARRGPEAVKAVQQLMEKNTPADLLVEIIDARFPTEAPRPKANPAAHAVAGASGPSQRPQGKPVETPVKWRQDPNAAIEAAVRRAQARTGRSR